MASAGGRPGWLAGARFARSSRPPPAAPGPRFTLLRSGLGLFGLKVAALLFPGRQLFVVAILGLADDAEQQQRARFRVCRIDLGHHPAGAVGQPLDGTGLAPIAAVRRDRKRLRTHNLAPDTAGKAKAIASQAKTIAFL